VSHLIGSADLASRLARGSMRPAPAPRYADPFLGDARPIGVSTAAVEALQGGPRPLSRVVVTRRSGVSEYAMLPAEVAEFERALVEGDADDPIECWSVEEPREAASESQL